ncbi:hypothetical protein ACFFX0_11255 [Citricoccus parietis]|uniref:Uncharacterized protein n=1 Tax=Citricoccus parietis TaxID=592307 RepID=A0ABV5FYI0_9MICC
MRVPRSTGACSGAGGHRGAVTGPPPSGQSSRSNRRGRSLVVPTTGSS